MASHRCRRFSPIGHHQSERVWRSLRVSLVLLGLGLAVRPGVAVAQAVPQGFSSQVIHVKLKEPGDVSAPLAMLPSRLASAVEGLSPLFSLPEEEIDRLRSLGEAASGFRLPNLNLWFQIRLVGGTDALALLGELRQVPSVEFAELAPLPAPLPAMTPDFSAAQGYLGPAPDGVDALYSSTLAGGDGSGVTIYDVEYNWLQSHEDLSRASGVSLLLDPGDANSPPGYPGCPAPCDAVNREHGTAVLGELVADNDSKGVTGISWGADVGLAPANTANLGYNPANAILLAAAGGKPGDVILVEQQARVCDLPDPHNTCANCGPAEWIQSVFDAIQTATATGITVVEAAGNGGVNLDQGACQSRFDRAVRDSGAIIVGAGGPPGSGFDRKRLSFSSYGTRLDLQGWGSGVVTTGYGSFYVNPDDPTNPQFFYTVFSGTSSASPIVAGAVANLQGYAIQHFGPPLPPSDVRSLLSETGSPQLGDTTENIGPRPNLRAALDELALREPPVALCVDVVGVADPGVCNARASIDNGSYDPNGDELVLVQTPSGPYPVGSTDVVTLEVEDSTGLSDSCQAAVTIHDQEIPVVSCNAPPTITPPDAPIRFTATAADNCEISTTRITGFRCFKVAPGGKRIDRERCRVLVDGSTIRIRRSGGAGSHIAWTVVAEDVHGNVATTQCEVIVARPGMESQLLPMQ